MDKIFYREFLGPRWHEKIRLEPLGKFVILISLRLGTDFYRHEYEPVCNEEKPDPRLLEGLENSVREVEYRIVYLGYGIEVNSGEVVRYWVVCQGKETRCYLKRNYLRVSLF